MMDLASSQEIKFNLKNSKLEGGYEMIKSILDDCPSALIVEILNDKDGNTETALNYLMDNPGLIEEYKSRKGKEGSGSGDSKIEMNFSNDKLQNGNQFTPTAPIDPSIIHDFDPNMVGDQDNHNANAGAQKFSLNFNMNVTNYINNQNIQNTFNNPNDPNNLLKNQPPFNPNFNLPPNQDPNLNNNNLPNNNFNNLNIQVNNQVTSNKNFNIYNYNKNPNFIFPNNNNNNDNNNNLNNNLNNNINKNINKNINNNLVNNPLNNNLNNNLNLNTPNNNFPLNHPNNSHNDFDFEDEEDRQSRLFIEQLMNEEKRNQEEEIRKNELLLNSMLEKESRDKQKELDEKVYHCTICDDEEVSISQMYIMEECYHKFCVECLQENFQYSIKNGNTKNIVCPKKECSRYVSYQEVKQVVKDKVLFEKYEKFLLESTLSSDPNCVFCPKQGCGIAMIREDGLKMNCPNPKCGFEFCFNCKEGFHDGFSCDQYQQWKIENGNSQQRFDSWVSQNSKKCPGCKANIEKNDGCNHMTCKCGYQFCWLCLKKYTSDHWTTNKTKCVQFNK